jgi:hypothetical protein
MVHSASTFPVHMIYIEYSGLAGHRTKASYFTMMASFSDYGASSSSTTIHDALQDASKSLTEALEVAAAAAGSNKLTSSDGDEKKKSAVTTSSAAAAAAAVVNQDSDEDPIMAAWLASQKPVKLDLNDWACVISMTSDDRVTSAQ